MTDKQIIYDCPHISLTDWGTYACKLYNPRDKNCIVSGGNCASNTNCPYKQNFEKDIDVPSKNIVYAQDAKDCEQYNTDNTDNTCCTCRNREWHRLYEDYKRKEQECDMWKNLTVDNGAVALKYQQQLDQLKKALNDIESICYEQDLDEDFFACEVLQKIRESEVE